MALIRELYSFITPSQGFCIEIFRSIIYQSALMPRGERSPGQTVVAFSCRDGLKSEIDRLAAEDKRTRSNWISAVLREHVLQRIFAEISAAAERYKSGRGGYPADYQIDYLEALASLKACAGDAIGPGWTDDRIREHFWPGIPPPPRFALDISEAMQSLKVSREEIEDAIRAKELKTVANSPTVKIWAEDLDEWFLRRGQ